MKVSLPDELTDIRVTPLSAGYWVNVLSHLDPKYGGMSAAVPALASAVASQSDYALSVAGFCAPDELCPVADHPAVSLQRIQAGYRHWLESSGTRRDFKHLIQHAAGIHIHGIWEQSTLLAARIAGSTNRPYIVSAHGMLQSWALNNKRWKKIIYSSLIERANLQRAACLHALTQAEAEDYRSYGLKNPIAVIPNGVNIPAEANPAAFRSQFPLLSKKRVVLFLGRIHFKKGLDVLVPAWAAAAKRWPDALLVLAGPDFENTRASVEQMISHFGIQDRVIFTGMLNDKLKWSALSAADCFVLPSYSEGLSVSVLEAVGLGVPAIVTKQCNLPEIAAAGCGWVIDPAAAQVESAINECLGLSSAVRAEMAYRGRSLVNASYTWPVVGKKMSEIYRWAQGGPPPSGVEIQFGESR